MNPSSSSPAARIHVPAPEGPGAPLRAARAATGAGAEIMAKTSRRRAADGRTLSSAAVAARFPKAPRGPTALRAFGYLIAFYAGLGAYVARCVPGWAFAAYGFFVFIRYFDLTHEEIHTRQDDATTWHVLRWVFSVSGPLQLGYTQLAQNHRWHHAHDGTAKDPDAWIAHASPLRAAAHCLTQPEQAVLRWVRAHGVDRRLVLDLGLNLATWLALAHVCTWPQFLLYNLVVRAANGASWFVFTFVLHHAAVYQGVAPVRLPAWLRATWLVAIGRNNLNAITYHFLHHAYGFVPARSLPALSTLVRGFPEGGDWVARGAAAR
jgi:hypothetical protein